MRAPWFWRSQSLSAKTVAAALAPAAWVYDSVQQMRWRIARPETLDVPVICMGNATLGGVGKTPFAILVYDMLKETGHAPWFLTRGYGGAEAGPLQVSPNQHRADQVGDEAVLLARRGPVIVSRNRPAGAAAAVANGAEAIIMDDGFQNPSLKKTLSILLIDAEGENHNTRVFPAGPFREPLVRAKMRAEIIVHVWRSADNAQRKADGLHAWLEPAHTPPAQKVVAFSGIGAPDKFFTTLFNAGFEIAERVAFPDHHPFNDQELAALKRLAKKEGAALITTEKDFVRLPDDFREHVLNLPAVMRINDPDCLKKQLLAIIDADACPR